MKAALIRADRQTDKHKAKWRSCNYANANKKKFMWQPKSKTGNTTFQLHVNKRCQEEKFVLLLTNRSLKGCLYLLFACNFVTQTPWSIFRTDNEVNSDRNIWAANQCNSVELRFPKSQSFLLLQALMETVQSSATVKCALDRSKHDCRIKMNWLVSFRAEILKMNNKLWKSYTTIILYHHQWALKILFTPLLQQVWSVT